jgi:hypothetical protein
LRCPYGCQPGIYANAHRGKVRKARLTQLPLRIVEEELRLKLRFVAEKPPPPAWAFQDLAMVADPPVEYFS